MNKIYIKYSNFNIETFKKNFKFVSSTQQNLIFFDTFSSDLVKNNLTIYYSQNCLVLQPIDSSNYSIIQPFEYSEVYKPNSLQNASFVHKIKNIVKNRALLKTKNVTFNLHCFQSNENMLNIDVYEFTEQKFLLINIYSQFKTKEIKQIEHNFFQKYFSKTKLSLFENIFSILKIEKTAYITKLNIQDLKNEKHFGKISNSILVQLTSYILINKNGIEQDIDSDFLHDFRVSIRRILVFLKNTKQFLGEETLDFINSFELILKNTNRLRDYDVFIQNYNISNNQNDWKPSKELTKFVLDKREQELSNVTNFLESNYFVTFFEKWITWLEEINNNKDDIENVANDVILSVFKKMSKLSIYIKANISNEHAHKLRIYVKHLRYSLDFFGNFVKNNYSQCNNFLEKLRLYQNKLGLITDLKFNILFLEEIINERNSLKNDDLQNHLLKQYQQIEYLKKDISKIYSKILKNFIKYYFYE